VAGDAIGVWRGAAAGPLPAQTFFVLAIQRRGRCTLRQQGREAVLATGDMALYQTALPYELAFDGAFRQTRVAIPAAPMRALSACVDALAGVALSGTQPQVALLGMMADCYFDTDYARLPGAAAGHAATALRQALAGCLLTQLGELEAKRSKMSRYHMDRIQQFALSRLGDNELSIAHVVEALDISAAHIHRLYAGEAQTFGAWLWETRVQLCHLALSNPSLAEQSISQIAFKFGFSHAAHFSRMYKARYGMTPSTWRNRPR
jgi:AraC-like DNA-binding protein